MGNVESPAAYRKKMLAVTEREAKLEKKLERKERYEQSFIPVIAIDTTDAILDKAIFAGLKDEISNEGKLATWSPLLVRERFPISKEPVYDVIRGFHQAAVLQQTDSEQFVEGIVYPEGEISDKDLVDLRLHAAVSGPPSLRFARVATYLRTAFAATDFAEHETMNGEKMTLEKGFEWTRANVLPTYYAVRNYDFRPEELAHIKTWVTERSQASEQDVLSLLKNVISPSSRADPELIRQVRSSGQGGKRNTGEILPGQVREFVKRFPGEENYPLQRILLPLLGEAGVLPIVVKEFMDDLPTELSQEEVIERIFHRIESVRRPLQEASLRDQSGAPMRAREKAFKRAEVKQKIIAGFEANLAAVEEGTASEIISYKSMAMAADTTPGVVFGVVKNEEGLAQRLQAGREHTKNSELPQTKEMAWFIGLMAAHGQVYVSESGKAGKVILSIRNPAIKERCHDTIRRLFAKESYEAILNPEGYPAVVVYTKYAPQLGDFRISEWPNTVREKYNWIMDNEAYLREFLSAYFDVRAQTINKGNYYNVRFPANHQVVVNMLREVLGRLGIERAFPITDSTKPEHINGLGIYELENIKRLASLIESSDPEKRKFLQEVKERVKLPKKTRQVFP